MNIYKLYKNNLLILSSTGNLNPIVNELKNNDIIITDIRDLFDRDIMGEYLFDVEEKNYSDFE